MPPKSSGLSGSTRAASLKPTINKQVIKSTLETKKTTPAASSQPPSASTTPTSSSKRKLDPISASHSDPNNNNKKKINPGALSVQNCSSMESLESSPSGVLSNTSLEMEDNSQAGVSTNRNSGMHLDKILLSNTAHQNTDRITNFAKINLDSPSILEKVKTTARAVYLTSSDNRFNLSKINPFKVAQYINKICGPVETVEHKKSGSLFILTKTFDQVLTLTKLKIFTEKQIPVSCTIAWSTQTCQGRLYAPEFVEDCLDDLLGMLEPCGVVGIRKLYKDPSRSRSPLYVLTFLGIKCPEKITSGYSIYKIDPFYPNPLRCAKCCRWDHPTIYCHSQQICSKCGSRGHSQADCNSETVSCANCKGPHNAISKVCPAYINAQEACKIKTHLNISYREARDKVRAGETLTSLTQMPRPIPNSQIPPLSTRLNSERDFPGLARKPAVAARGQVQSGPVPFIDGGYHPRWSECDATQASLEHVAESQEVADSPCITPGQRTPLRTLVPGRRQLPCVSNVPPVSRRSPAQPGNTAYDGDWLQPITQDNLFPISESQSSQRNSSTHHTTTSNQGIIDPQTENPSNIEHSDTFTEIKNLFIKCIPIIIKLFIASNISDKIVFHGDGKCSASRRNCHNVISNLGLTSLSTL